jgi:hypothetical protein
MTSGPWHDQLGDGNTLPKGLKLNNMCEDSNGLMTLGYVGVLSSEAVRFPAQGSPLFVRKKWNRAV